MLPVGAQFHLITWQCMWSADTLSESSHLQIFEHKIGNFQKQDCNWPFNFKLFPGAAPISNFFPGAAPISNFSQALPRFQTFPRRCPGWLTASPAFQLLPFCTYRSVQFCARPLVHSSWWCMWSNDGQSWMCEAKEWNAVMAEIW